MKKLLICAVSALILPFAHAEDLSFAYEGDAVKRKRLEALQSSKTPPELTVSSWINSEAQTLASMKGKIVVLDFWATWCGPCIRSIPHNNEIAEKYKNDVVFIGVCHPRGSEKMGDMVKSKGIKYPVCADPDGATIKAYGVNGYPDYYVFDRDGSLAVADCANAQVEAVLAKLVAKPVPVPPPPPVPVPAAPAPATPAPEKKPEPAPATPAAPAPAAPAPAVPAPAVPAPVAK